MNCPKCNIQIPDSSAKFCPSCGIVINQTSLSTNSSIPSPTRSNKKTLIIIGGVIVLFLIMMGFLAVSGIGKLFQKENSPLKMETNIPKVTGNPKSTVAPPTATPAKSKYDIDTDNDSIPDFVEIAIGYDPNKDECFLKACEGFDPNSANASKVNVMFILDSSGSMAQMAGSQIKMVAAKEAMKKYITQVNANTNVGLMVYGHKGSNNTSDKSLSCSSIDILYPLGSVNKDQFNQAVDSFQPTGWTPIGSSLRKAKDAFVGKENDKNIILLVSDGEETCESDPIGAATEVKNSGMKLQIDVIGFNLGAGAKAQLQQVADLTSGTFYNAQTSEEFSKVINNWQENFGKNVDMLQCNASKSNDFWMCFVERSNIALGYLMQMSNELSFPNLNTSKYTFTFDNYDTKENIAELYKKIQEHTSQLYGEQQDYFNKALEQYKSNENIINKPPIKN